MRIVDAWLETRLRLSRAVDVLQVLGSRGLRL